MDDNIEKLDEPTIIDSQIETLTEEPDNNEIHNTLIDMSNNTPTEIIKNDVNRENTNTITNIQEIQSPPPIEKHNTQKYIGYWKRLSKQLTINLIVILLLTITIIIYNQIKTSTIKYVENSNIDYQVCLKNNNYYKEKCLGENIEYISSITDKIRVDFNYNKVYQNSTKEDYEYFITSKVIITKDDDTNNELYKVKKNLTKKLKGTLTGNVMTISESIDIKFDDFNNLAQNYINDYSLLGKSNLIVSLMLKDEKSIKSVASITLPLTNLTYSISKSSVSNKTTEKIIKNNSIIKYLLIVAIIILSIAMIYTMYRLVKFIIQTYVKSNKYEKQLKQILSTYDRVIITTDNDTIVERKSTVLNVSSFFELLDVRDTIDKPIIYHKINNIKSEFYVQDIDKTYIYTMKEADFK